MQMNFKMLLISVMALCAVVTNGQETITLQKCQQQAQENYPVTRQKLLLPEIEALQSDNISSAYLPQLTLEGQSTWQNEVTGLNLSIPGMSVEKLEKLQYKAQVVFSQIIYNGGKKRLQTQLSNQGTKIEQQQLEVELYALHFVLNKAYFSALLLQESLNSYEAMLTSLNANLSQVNSAIENGTLTVDKAAVLEAEIITVEQGVYKLQSQKQAALHTLNLYTGFDIETTDKLELPLLAIDDSAIDRPEYDLFEAQQNMFQLSNNLESASRRPLLSGFGQLGYGLPGYNMLKNETSEFYMVGAKLSWKITDWKKSSRNTKLNNLKIEHIGYQKEIFDQKLTDLIQQQQANLNYLKKVMASDEKLVSARKKITDVSASQLANGMIRSADYVSDLQQAVAAEIRQKQHQIENAMTIIAINTLKGSEF